MTCSFDILTVNETAMLDVYIKFFTQCLLLYFGVKLYIALWIVILHCGFKYHTLVFNYWYVHTKYFNILLFHHDMDSYSAML